MRAMIPFLIANLLLVSGSLAAAPRACAEDAPDDASAAGKSYRDGWWAETGGGNLNQAIDLYEKAAAAEGPAAVKARALYRKAVVLQRIGKTEDAIRALERLAKDHPLEAALQTDARTRLAEWTAVDLKTSFAEWYRRYQYSPEFQAKIVDLVLKLGATDASAGLAASSEILTIGTPAIPALRQHVESSNAQLRERVVSALLLLGEIPSLEALRRTSGWRNDYGCWTKLRVATAEARARLRSEAKADQPWDQGLIAALDGPLALLAWANAAAPKDMIHSFLSMALVWDGKGPEPVELRAPLLTIAQDKGFDNSTRESATYWLFAIHGVDVALAEKWAGGDDKLLRRKAVHFLAEPRGGADTWNALRRLLGVASTWESDSPRTELVNALLSRLDVAPSGGELDRLADDLLAAAVGVGQVFTGPSSAPARAVVARMIDRARDSREARQLFDAWQHPGGRSDSPTVESDAGPLTAWIRSSPYDTVRESAVKALTNGPAPWQQRTLALLAEPGLSLELRFQLFASLLQSKAIVSLLGDTTSRRAILACVRGGEGDASDTTRGRYVIQFFEALKRLQPDAIRSIAAEWLVDPEVFPQSLLWSTYSGWGVKPHLEAPWLLAIGALAPAWRKAWPEWTPSQRDAAVAGIDTRFPRQDPEFRPFLQICARDRSNGISPTSRATLLQYFDPITTADFKLAFDLDTPKGVDGAIELIADGVNLPDPLPDDLFDALKPGLRPGGPAASVKAILKLFEGDPNVRRPLMEAALAHQDVSVQMLAVSSLEERESSDDLPYWLAALALPSVELRAKAATGLGRIAHPDATKALVKALDDPNSSVRDAVIASLEAIQKIEDLKKTWREKVR